MASIVAKKQGGQTYYYLVESARVDGKPRIVSQQYLGSAAEVTAKLAGASAGEPVRTQHKGFGDLAAVWAVLERLDVAGVIDAVVPRYANAAVSVGTYIALATANRVVDPCSKLAFADWWDTTAGPRFTKVRGAAVDHRRFWDAMDRLDPQSLERIEAELSRRIVTEFGLDLSGLVLDMTNFATYIDSTNDRAPIAQRGKAKQKRLDLRLVALALVVTRDGGIPLISHAYPGDRPDVTQFADLIDQLVSRYQDLTGTVESLTIVYDAGQNSAANHERVEACRIGFVGSLPPSDHPDLLAIPTSDYTAVDPDRYPGLTCLDTQVTALGVTRRAVLTHSPTLHAAQSRGLDQTLATARRRLSELQARLARGRTRRHQNAVQADIDTITKPRWVRGHPHRHPDRPGTARPTPDLPDQHPRPGPPRGPDLRQTGPVHQPRHLDPRRDRGRLPLPEPRRVRVPADEGPPRGLLRPHAPLDRPEDPGPRLLLRPGTHDRAPDAPRGRPRRAAPVRTGTPLNPGRHPGDRAALPRRRQRPPPRPTDPHRPEPDPAAPGRAIRHQPVRAHPVTPDRLR